MPKKRKKNVLIRNEYPYEIPENWIWCSYDTICDVRDGTHHSPQYVDKGYPLITSKNLKNGELSFENISYVSREDHLKISMRSKVDEGDLLFAMIGTIGNPVLIEKIDVEFSIKNVALFKPYKELILAKYLKYLLLEKSNMDRLLEKSNGSTQKFIALGKLRSHPIPVSPLPEQQRIVNRIESLFEKIDKAEVLINEAREGFEKRKEAILAKAFRGELTEKWRAENNCSIEQWEITTLGKKIKLVSGQDVARKFCNDNEEGIPYILGASNLSENGFSVERWIIKPKVVSVKDDILLSVKGTIGKVYLQIEDEINISRQIMAIRNNGDWNSKFLYYFVLNESKRLSNEGNGLIPGIPRSKVLDIDLRLPKLDEQEEIVMIIEKLLECEEASYDLSSQIELINEMKKSILAKAFRGELGTNNEKEVCELLLK